MGKSYYEIALCFIKYKMNSKVRNILNVKIESDKIKNDLKVVLCQTRLGRFINSNEKDLIAGFSPHFVCLPELFFVSSRIKNYKQAVMLYQDAKAYIKLLSEELNTIVIGGTLVCYDDDKLVSRCYVYKRGYDIGYYDKVNLTENEKKAGFKSGNKYSKYDEHNVKFSTLICNDIFSDEGFIWAKEQGCQIIFMPTGSPYRADEKIEDKYKRDNDLFVRKAGISGCDIIKICGVGSIYGNKLQGRSLIANDIGVKFRIEPENELKQYIIFIEMSYAQKR